MAASAVFEVRRIGGCRRVPRVYGRVRSARKGAGLGRQRRDGRSSIMVDPRAWRALYSGGGGRLFP